VIQKLPAGSVIARQQIKAKVEIYAFGGSISPRQRHQTTGATDDVVLMTRGRFTPQPLVLSEAQAITQEADILLLNGDISVQASVHPWKHIDTP
jgi:hypothetical protein